VYNLGAGRGVTVQEMLNAAEKIVGKTIPSTPAGRRAGDPAVLLASNAKAREELA
jgi:UDP-glucose 4-epimerase